MTLVLISQNGAQDVIGTYRPNTAWDYLAKQLKDAARIYLGAHVIDYSTMTAKCKGGMWAGQRIELWK